MTHAIRWTIVVWIVACRGSTPALSPTRSAGLIASLDRAAPPGMSPAAWTDAQTMFGCAAADRRVTSSVMGIIDFGLASEIPRLWVMDLDGDAPIRSYRVSHGSGSGGRYAETFSDVSGSHASSLGLYRTAETYSGKHGHSRRLDGLEESNGSARSRAIVIHGADYMTDAFVAANGRAGRSWGCPAIAPDVAREVVDALPEGSLLWAWHPDAAWREGSRWLHCDDPGDG